MEVLGINIKSHTQSFFNESLFLVTKATLVILGCCNLVGRLSSAFFSQECMINEHVNGGFYKTILNSHIPILFFFLMCRASQFFGEVSFLKDS